MDYDDVIRDATKAMAETNNDYEDGALQWSSYVDDARAAAPILMEYGARLMREAAKSAVYQAPIDPQAWDSVDRAVNNLDPATIVREAVK